MKYDGERLTNEIARRKQSVPDFAKDAGLSRFSVYRALSGGKASTRTLGKLAAALEIDNPIDLCKPMKEVS